MNDNQIAALNEVIKQAIDHGGDAGGPYFCNKVSLLESMKHLAEISGLQNYDIKFYDDTGKESDEYYPAYVKKGGR